MFLDEILQFFLFKEFNMLVFKIENDFSSSSNFIGFIFKDNILSDVESGTGNRLPSVLFIVVIFRNNNDFVGN